MVSDRPGGECREKKQDADWPAGKLDQNKQEMGGSDWLVDGVEVSDWPGGGVEVADWQGGGVKWLTEWLLKMSCDWSNCALGFFIWTNERPAGGQCSTGQVWHSG